MAISLLEQLTISFSPKWKKLYHRSSMCLKFVPHFKFLNKVEFFQNCQDFYGIVEWDLQFPRNNFKHTVVSTNKIEEFSNKFEIVFDF